MAKFIVTHDEGNEKSKFAGFHNIIYFGTVICDRINLIQEQLIETFKDSKDSSEIRLLIAAKDNWIKAFYSLEL